VWTITSAVDLAIVRDAVAEIARNLGMEEERIFDFMLCISEAATNTIKHADRGELTLHQCDDALLAVVSDRGPGIPALSLPEVALRRGFSTAVSLGMGYKAMISLADRVYLATGPQGTTVGIEMGLHAPAPQPAFVGVPEVW
jgi:anti-sigma regulatory factor (Ser/Thr protein kinase)